MPVANEGLVRDSLLKMYHNPGGDWNPGWGGRPNVSPQDFQTSKEQKSFLQTNLKLPTKTSVVP